MMFGDCFADNWGFLGDFGPWGWIGLVLNLVYWGGLIAGVVILVVWAVRQTRVSTTTGPYAPGQPTAKEILRTRYAQGEISQEQYQLKKQVIG